MGSESERKINLTVLVSWFETHTLAHERAKRGALVNRPTKCTLNSSNLQNHPFYFFFPLYVSNQKVMLEH